jgi:flagella basal body P-ring formation protein FlgA
MAAHAADAARARVVAPDRLEVTAVRCDPAPPADAFETAESDGPNAAGYTRVRLRLFREGKAVGEGRVVVVGRVLGPALVAKATLRRGESIPADAIEVRELDTTAIREPVLREAAQALPLVPERTIAAGRPVTSGLLRAPYVVRRGLPVDLKIDAGDFSIVAGGIAVTDGAPGDRVIATNSATGARVRGVVEHDGSLRVEGPAPGRNLR